jgi:hypothetical protein
VAIPSPGEDRPPHATVGASTVGVYDRPASADRRARWLKRVIWAVAAAAAVGGWWWSGAPGLG